MLIINTSWTLFIVMGCFAFGSSDDGDGRRIESGRPELAELIRKAISAAERTPRPAPLIMEIAIEYAKSRRAYEVVKVANIRCSTPGDDVVLVSPHQPHGDRAQPRHLWSLGDRI